MGKIKICIIGAGNISNTRHIPAILQNEDMQIVGIISDEKKKIVRTVKNHPCLKNCHMLVINQTENVGDSCIIANGSKEMLMRSLLEHRLSSIIQW